MHLLLTSFSFFYEHIELFVKWVFQCYNAVALHKSLFLRLETRVAFEYVCMEVTF